MCVNLVVLSVTLKTPDEFSALCLGTDRIEVESKKKTWQQKHVRKALYVQID